MKILNSYRFYRGRSSSKDAPIPALVPPDSQNLLKSISISETVDLLCEGPIYGLVDQFGKKVYGLDMLKGIYLNKVPVMNYDGKYNFRSIVMEINLGTENQTPLQNFRNISIWKPANFKLLGPITSEKDIRGDPNNGSSRDFTSWALGWPNQAKDPFIYVHHIRNKDVKKIKISMLAESLYDTIDKGSGKGQAGKMGMSTESNVAITVTCGVEGTNKIFVKEYNVSGTITSPYAFMLGEPIGQFNSPSISKASAGSNAGALYNKNTAIPIGASNSILVKYPTAPQDPITLLNKEP